MARITYNECQEKLDFIISEYGKAGFGTLPKSDIDLIFYAYYKKYVFSQDKTEYEIARELRITPQRVRALNEKYSLKFGAEDDSVYIKQFFDILTHTENIKFKDPYITIPIYDVAVKNCVESYLEKCNLLLDTTLNPREFKLKIDDFLRVYMALRDIYLSPENQDDYDRSIRTIVTGDDILANTLNLFFPSVDIKEEIIRYLGTNDFIALVRNKDFVGVGNKILTAVVQHQQQQ